MSPRLFPNAASAVRAKQIKIVARSPNFFLEKLATQVKMAQNGVDGELVLLKVRLSCLTAFLTLFPLFPLEIPAQGSYRR